MKTVKINLLGKIYSMDVAPEDETMIHQTAEYVNQRFSEFRKDLMGKPESTIAALATFSIAEDLFIERKKHSQEAASPEVSLRLTELLSAIKQANS
jgi:cell division protein ZapA